MQLVPSGSRGAVRLHLQGTDSNDDTNTSLITSQQWCFQSQFSSQAPRLSHLQLKTDARTSTRAQLTRPTVPPAPDRFSLYPGSDAEAGSSVDADIIAAQSFLRRHHPDIEIPDHVLSRIISDNAQSLGGVGYRLDGSFGFADAQAIAVLGPVSVAGKRTYAIVCIADRGRNELLLHQLEVLPQDANLSSGPASAKAESKATDSCRLRFVAAHRAERTFSTPVLQIINSPDQKHLAVRTHTGTIFLALKHHGRPNPSLWLSLETLHEVKYGVDGFTQHQDVCFSPTSHNLAAAVDRAGNVDLFHIPTTGEIHPQPANLASESPAPSPTADVASGSESADRPSPRAPIASASTDPAESSAITVDRIRILDPSLAVEGSSRVSTSSDAEPASDQQARSEAPHRITFGSDERTIFLLSSNSLLHAKLNRSGTSTDTAILPRVSVVLQSSFSVSSFRRARFFSMASSQLDWNTAHSLLAVCSSDAIYWLDLNEPSNPLFSTAHHRGDDPTLTLTLMPPLPSVTTSLSQHEHDILMWALSSRRNSLVSCYTVRVLLRAGSGQDLLEGEATEASSLRSRCVLDGAPVQLPDPLPGIEEHIAAAPPVFLDFAELLPLGPGSASWLRFGINQHGALSAQLLQSDAVQFADTSRQSEHVVELDIVQPAVDTLLYVDGSDMHSSAVERVDFRDKVQSRNLDYQKLHRALFSTKGNVSPSREQRGIRSDISNDVEHLAGLLAASAKDHASVQAATLSVAQLIRSFDRHVSSETPDVEHVVRGPKTSWFSALHLPPGEETDDATAKAIEDLIRDVRHVLPSLRLAPAQLEWSNAASAVLRDRADGIDSANDRPGNPFLPNGDTVEFVLKQTRSQNDVGTYLPTKAAVQPWTPNERREFQGSLRDSTRQMMLDLALEAETFLRPKARIMDEGAPTQRPQQRPGTNWTAFEHRDIYHFVEEQGSTIPPPHVGSVGLSFFAPLRSGDVESSTGSGSGQDDPSRALEGAELESLLPSTSSAARLLLAEWQLGEDPTAYRYLDPFEGLHRLPRASRLGGPTARARSRSFSRASSASTEERSRSRSRSRSRKQSAAPSFSQMSEFGSQTPMSPYRSSSVSHSQAAEASSSVPPTLVSRRKRRRDVAISHPQSIRSPGTSLSTPQRTTQPHQHISITAAQSQPAAPRFGYGGSFGDLTPTISPASSQVGTPTQSHPTASTQIEAGRFGARPTKPDRPPKKKKRASGF